MIGKQNSGSNVAKLFDHGDANDNMELESVSNDNSPRPIEIAGDNKIHHHHVAINQSLPSDVMKHEQCCDSQFADIIESLKRNGIVILTLSNSQDAESHMVAIQKHFGSKINETPPKADHMSIPRPVYKPIPSNAKFTNAIKKLGNSVQPFDNSQDQSESVPVSPPLEEEAHPVQEEPDSFFRRARRTSVQQIVHKVVEIQHTLHDAEEGAKQKLMKSGFARFISTEDVDVEDLDQGVNAMALLNALILTIPYQLIGSVGSGYFDWLSDELKKCKRESTSAGYNFHDIQLFYREELLCCIYASICGLILSTFYFLFKRSHPAETGVWKEKARLLIILLFVCTGMSLIALMALSNTFVSWYFIRSGSICKLEIFEYTGPAMLCAIIALVLACYSVF